MTTLDLGPGSHVCWIVDDPSTFRREAEALLCGARPAGEKPVLFAPIGSPVLAELGPLVEVAADPGVAFLGGGPLDPDAMFSMFRALAATARAEGYRRLRVVADMDWLLPLRPTTDDIVGFELLLDLHAKALDATIVCAYRTASFDVTLLAGVRCVHPADFGAPEPPQFRLVAADDATWSLAGEVDIAVAGHFETAMRTAATVEHCVVDVAGLRFADVGSMRAIAAAGGRADHPLRLVGVAPSLRRGWELAGFADAAPGVELA